VEDESIGEIVVAIDTSGSIGQEQINEFATELVSICEVVTPDAIRILWWDTMVHGEQVFTDNYTNIGQMLKPLGGGGTRVACVSEYINNKKVEAEAVLVFTDGYVEQSPKWDISAPTLWLVTDNTGWQPPAGKKVIVNK
jgi:predicted metal-dependent peptidase